jgi:iron complex transport system ATP-binding protein
MNRISWIYKPIEIEKLLLMAQDSSTSGNPLVLRLPLAMEVVAHAFPLQARDLTIGYRTGQLENVLFEGITLSLKPGKLTCFMGPNGIGKSTLIRVLAGLQKPLKGEVSTPEEKKIALVLTDKISTSNMSVWDLVSYGRYPYLSWGISFSRHDLSIIEQSIDEVGISNLSNKKIPELSDGQLQLAMIARALAQETPVLLLDEPTAHLDLNHRVEIMKLLLRLAREKNKAILVATHELDLALQMADEIWLATTHKKIKTGIPEDLVLDGSFDEIFQFKGFDLKTGKIQHTSYQNHSIHLQGEGHEFLWTKNALEREGFYVSDQGTISIAITHHGSMLAWETNNTSFRNIKELLDYLKET